MSYTVIWKRTADEEFQRHWTRTDDPGAILGAARKIEAKLQQNAIKAGEGRDKDENRMIFEPPLGMTFWVSELDRIAMITGVWRIR